MPAVLDARFRKQIRIGEGQGGIPFEAWPLQYHARSEEAREQSRQERDRDKPERRKRRSEKGRRGVLLS